MNTYYVKTLKTAMCVVPSGSSLSYTAPQTFCWQFISQGTSYVIFNISATNQRLVLGALKQNSSTAELSLFTMSDLSGPQKNQIDYLWDLTREGMFYIPRSSPLSAEPYLGVFIQGADQGSSHAAVAVRDDNQVVASTFKPLDAFRQSADTHRYIWHILPDSGAKQVRIWNELHLNQLTYLNSSTVGGTICVPDGSGGNPIFYPTPLASGNGYSLISATTRTPLSTANVKSDLTGQCLTALQDPNRVPPMQRPQAAILWAQQHFKSWNFVPITSVLSGPLITMPKCLLGPGTLTNINNVETMKNQVLFDAVQVDRYRTRISPYQPGQAATRFRVINYGSIFIAVSDISRRVVSNTTQDTVDMSQVMDEKFWFTVANNQIISLADLQPKLWQIVIGIDDIPERLKPWYIILGHSHAGYPVVLSVGQNGTVNAVPYDPFDANQLWKYYDWGSSKFLMTCLL